MKVWQANVYKEGLKYVFFHSLHHIHSHHLVLMVNIGSCLQQSLDCCGVSLPSSYLQRNTKILYERQKMISMPFCYRKLFLLCAYLLHRSSKYVQYHVARQQLSQRNTTNTHKNAFLLWETIPTMKVLIWI